MNLRVAVGLMLAVAPLASAVAMPVSAFLAESDALKKKGPLVMLSGDFKLLMQQVKEDAAQLRAENRAAVAAGRPKAYCTPAAGAKLSDKDILAAMQSVPAAERTQTSTKDALRAYLARRHPCAA